MIDAIIAVFSGVSVYYALNLDFLVTERLTTYLRAIKDFMFITRILCFVNMTKILILSSALNRAIIEGKQKCNHENAFSLLTME